MDKNEMKMNPADAIKRWTPKEEKILCYEYKSGVSISRLAIKYGRTEGAIRFRLEKFGMIQSSSQMPQNEDIEIESPKLCADCRKKFFVDEDHPTLFTNVCGACYRRRVREKENIKEKPTIIKRRIDEGIAGTREDHKKMRSWKLS